MAPAKGYISPTTERQSAGSRTSCSWARTTVPGKVCQVRILLVLQYRSGTHITPTAAEVPCPRRTKERFPVSFPVSPIRRLGDVRPLTLFLRCYVVLTLLCACRTGWAAGSSCSRRLTLAESTRALPLLAAGRPRCLIRVMSFIEERDPCRDARRQKQLGQVVGGWPIRAWRRCGGGGS